MFLSCSQIHTSAVCLVSSVNACIFSSSKMPHISLPFSSPGSVLNILSSISYFAFSTQTWECGAQLNPLFSFSLPYCDSQSWKFSITQVYLLPSLLCFFSLLIIPHPSPSNWNHSLRCTLKKIFFLLLFWILFRNGSPNFLIRMINKWPSLLYLLHGFPWSFSNLTPTIPLHCVLTAFYA